MDRVRVFGAWREVFLLCIGVWAFGVTTGHAARLFHHPVSYHLRSQCGKSRAFSNARERFRERKRALSSRYDKHLVRIAKNRSRTRSKVKNFSDGSNWRMGGMNGF